ncbi:MAG: 2-deoxy-D-gluconate 3-dehydrogenase [Phycisphaerae bacterium]|nr:2-deoxy-D-gluconate 3-dehydrogenase [Phycisphaerae bacterium]
MQGTRIVLIGGSGGIGQKTASNLMAHGAQVCITGRDPGRLETASSALGCPGHVLEASDFEATGSMLESARDRMGGLDGVVCLAGSILLKPITMTSQSEFDETILRNLTTAFSVTRASVRVLSGGGSVVLMSSAAATMGLPNHEAIAAAKGGVEGLVRSSAATYARKGIRINAIAPGLVDTPMASRITASERTLEHSKNMHPLGRIGKPEDVANLLSFLMDPANDWITGQILGVDGGLSRVRIG